MLLFFSTVKCQWPSHFSSFVGTRHTQHQLPHEVSSKGSIYIFICIYDFIIVIAMAETLSGFGNGNVVIWHCTLWFLVVEPSQHPTIFQSFYYLCCLRETLCVCVCHSLFLMDCLMLAIMGQQQHTKMEAEKLVMPFSFEANGRVSVLNSVQSCCVVAHYINRNLFSPLSVFTWEITRNRR